MSAFLKITSYLKTGTEHVVMGHHESLEIAKISLTNRRDIAVLKSTAQTVHCILEPTEGEICASAVIIDKSAYASPEGEHPVFRLPEIDSRPSVAV